MLRMRKRVTETSGCWCRAADRSEDVLAFWCQRSYWMTLEASSPASQNLLIFIGTFHWFLRLFPSNLIHIFLHILTKQNVKFTHGKFLMHLINIHVPLEMLIEGFFSLYSSMSTIFNFSLLDIFMKRSIWKFYFLYFSTNSNKFYTKFMSFIRANIQ